MSSRMRCPEMAMGIAMNHEGEHDVGDSDMYAMKDRMMKAGGMKESDFKALPDGEMNHITLDAEDFPGLSDDGVGDEVMFCVKGVIRSISQPTDYDSPRMGGGVGSGGKKYKDEILVKVDLLDAALIHGKLPPLGSGERFSRLRSKLSRQGVRDPGALAASI